MVLIQVLIGEVRLNDTDEFGVELGIQDSLLFDRSLVSDVQTLTTTTTNQVSGTAVTTEQQNIINANGQPGFNFNNQPLGNNLSTTALAGASKVATQGLSSFSLNRVNSELGFGGFVFSASSNSVSMLLRALQEKRRLEVLSRPQLMALDGQPGYVQVGQNVPRILATNIDPLGGQTNSITYEPVGLILQVVPRISPDGLVVMQITANKSEVGPEAEGIPISVSNTGQVLRAPRIDITQALTTVSALSGQTVVLGGLMQTRKIDVHRRVPIIADIPLIGDLFRYDAVNEERRELLIILTPQIIYNKLDSDLVKQIESSRMSWILSDTINLHGEAGLRSRCDEWYDGEMESIYPNFIPPEGVLPLSRGQLPPDGDPTECMPGMESIVPGTEYVIPGTDRPVESSEPLPIPSVRQSPSSARPMNDRYGAIEAAEAEGVTPAVYYPTTMQTIEQ
jgi:type II secretory pathway component GspD/PulD (secretin)